MLGSAVIGGISGNRASKRTAAAMQEANAINRESLNLAKEQWANYRNLYQSEGYKTAEGVEAQTVRDAMAAGTEESQRLQAGKAGNQVTLSLANAQKALQRSRMSRGITPSSGASADEELKLSVAGSLGQADAMTKAAQDERRLGIALRKDAVSTGRGLSSQATAMMGNAVSGANNYASNTIAQGANEVASANQLGYDIGSLARFAQSKGWISGGNSGAGQLAAVPQAPADYDWGAMASAMPRQNAAGTGVLH